MTLPAEQAVERVFSESLERALLAYPGKWTAIVDEHIVAAGDSPSEVLGAARKAGHKDVLLHRVPEEGKAYFF